MLRLRPYKKEDAGRIVTWVTDHDGFSTWCADLLDWPLDWPPWKSAAWPSRNKAMAGL